MASWSTHFRAFFRSFVRSPHHVGSVAPSSRALARALARTLPSGATTVVELGPGTGAVTAELRRAIHPDGRLVLVEITPEFSEHLTTHFPGVEVITGDARHLPELLAARGVTTVDAVVCCIPLGNLSRADVTAILEAARSVLRPGGHFAMFQYLGVDYRNVRATFGAVRVGWVPWNLPPAFVFSAARSGE